MRNETTNTAVPKLRFPEFEEAGEWEEKKLGTIAKVVASGDLDTTLFNAAKSISHPYPVYSNALEKKGIYGYYSAPKYPANSVTITARGNLGFAFHRKVSFMGIGRLIVAYNLINLDSFFLNECWNHCAFIPHEVTSIPQLTAVTAKAVVLPIPSLPEQQKIAATLSSLDDLLTAQSAKLAALQVHKLGLMQGLFPAEGETVPKLRFPEFQEAGEWEEKTLGEVCKAFSGGTPSTSQKKYYGGDIPFIRSAEIDRERTELFLTEEGLTNSSAKLIGKGDILFALYGANSGDVAISKQHGAINQAILCLRSKDSNVFIFHFLTHRKDWIIRKYLQGGQGNLSGEIVKSIDILFPNLAEQQKIADCLSSLDNRITAQIQQIEALKLHKKGLMQSLFPAAAEPTA